MKLVKLMALAALALTVSGAAAFAADNGTADAGKAHGGKMFEKMDTNKDGAVSKDESQAFHAAKFDEADTNKDGKISKEEMKAHHDAMKAKWAAKKAEKGATK